MRELPGVIDAAAAKSLVEQSLARSWAARDKLTLRLPPRLLTLEPGAQIELSLSPKRWTVERCTVEGFVVVAELRPSWSPSVSVLGDAGRITPNSDIVAGTVSLALFDIPDILEQSASAPTLLLAASAPTRGWKSRGVEINAANQQFMVRSAIRKTVLGRALHILAPGEPYLIDTIGTVEVELIDPDQWLVSCDDQALADGGNLAVLGGELIQFGQAVPSGPGRFQLGRLLRGRGGTEWATQIHAADETFALLERATIRAVVVPAFMTGSLATASAANSLGTSRVVSAESLRPLSPVGLEAVIESSGNLNLSWTRRSRKGRSWLDEVDVPLGEGGELYRVTVIGPLQSMELQSGGPALTIAAADLAIVGSGPASVQVSQIGDCGASRPAECNLNLP